MKLNTCPIEVTKQAGKTEYTFFGICDLRSLTRVRGVRMD